MRDDWSALKEAPKPWVWGTSYYPESVDESEWADDLAAIRSAGLTLLRVTDLCWSAIEPREGVYAFDWLDRFLNLAHERGLSVVICTPTAAPPPWLTTQYPEILIQRRDGSRHHPGGRRDVDVDNEIFRHFSIGIARVLGERYGPHPAVIGWQLDNELIGPEGEPPESHTRATTFRFRQYLKRVHEDLKTLNQRWGTRFWSQEYADWGEITTPLNPRSTMGQVLDYSRYFSDSQKAFLELQYTALRQVIPARQWIGHNSTAVFNRGLDHADWAQSLDVAGWDAYFGAAGRLHPDAFAAMAHDWFRAAKGLPFWIYETNSVDDHLTPAFVGEMRARGAAGVILWHWRSHRANAENETNTICDHSGVPDETRLMRLRALTRRPELAQALPQTWARRTAALLFCPDCVRTSLTPDPYIQRGLARVPSYLDILVGMYRALRRMGVAVDVLRPGDPLDGYRLLAMPSARLLSPSAADYVGQFVEEGGSLLGMAKTAHQDIWGAYSKRPGEALEEVLGFTQRRNVRAEGSLSIRLRDGQLFTAEPWAESVVATTASVFGEFSGGGLEGQPAALVNRFGQGQVVYAAAYSPDLLEHLIPRACLQAQIPHVVHSCRDVALFPEANGERWWVFNYGKTPIQCGRVVVKGGDFAIVEHPTDLIESESVAVARRVPDGDPS